MTEPQTLLEYAIEHGLFLVIPANEDTAVKNQGLDHDLKHPYVQAESAKRRARDGIDTSARM